MIDNQTIGVLFALLAAVCWGLGASLYKIVIKTEHSLFLTIAIRGAIAVPFIAVVTFFVNGFASLGILFSPEVLPILLISSAFVSIGDLSFFGSLQRMDVSKAMPIASIYPLFTAILLIIFGLETITSIVLIGIIILILGLGFLSQQEKENSADSKSEEKLKVGLALAVIAAIFWSFGIYTLRLLLDFPEVDVYSLATVRFGLLTSIFIIIWGINTTYNYKIGKDDPASLEHITKKVGLVFGIGGILSWGIGAISFFSSIELIGAARATPISSINPLISVIIGIAVLKEKLKPLQAIGILLMIFGSIFVSLQQS
ncbi:MAG: DMT family transporter [Candidatus Heimdallarchaeota archaeon]|nr:MAG: DMT family transporter [Candidatus Heimdallarchaeota archaeon]